MKLSVFLLIAVTVLICQKSVQAGSNFILGWSPIDSYDDPGSSRNNHFRERHHRKSYGDPMDTTDNLDSYRNNHLMERHHRKSYGDADLYHPNRFTDSQHRTIYGDPKTYNALNRNSNFRDNDHVEVQSHRSRKVFNDLEKETTTVVVKDDKGIVQESTHIVITNRKHGKGMRKMEHEIMP